jgi:uncharacterized protein (DUF305 family)
MGITLRLAIVLILVPTPTLLSWQQESPSHSRVASVNSDWSELLASMENMHRAVMSIKPSGNNDIDFVRLMLPHHQAAVDMAETELKYGKDPQMSRLAQEIITDQQSEIELMQLWLKQHQSSSLKLNQTPAQKANEEY